MSYTIMGNITFTPPKYSFWMTHIPTYMGFKDRRVLKTFYGIRSSLIKETTLQVTLILEYSNMEYRLYLTTQNASTRQIPLHKVKGYHKKQLEGLMKELPIPWPDFILIR